MDPRDFLGPTVPATQPIANPPPAPIHTPPPATSRSLSAQKSRIVFAAIVAGAVLVVLLIGVAIGRATKSSTSTVPSEKLAQLVVTSKPVDANVTVDGRFVGVSPVERIDLEPGKHSIVIDAFGYQPYAGTVEMDKGAKTRLKVTLAPMGTKETTGGEFIGAKSSTNATVPPTALVPFSLTGTGTSKEGEAAGAKGTTGSKPARTYSAPRPPRRDCSGERSKCRDSCSSAGFSCTSRCQGCGSCSTNWDECNRTCNTCKQGCEQNVRFCESSCESNYDSCSASQ